MFTKRCRCVFPDLPQRFEDANPHHYSRFSWCSARIGICCMDTTDYCIKRAKEFGLSPTLSVEITEEDCNSCIGRFTCWTSISAEQ